MNDKSLYNTGGNSCFGDRHIIFDRAARDADRPNDLLIHYNGDSTTKGDETTVAVLDVEQLAVGLRDLPNLLRGHVKETSCLGLLDSNVNTSYKW